MVLLAGLDQSVGDLDELLQSELVGGRQQRPSPLLRDAVTGLLGQVALLERLDQVLRMVNAEAGKVAVTVVVLKGLDALLRSQGVSAAAPVLVEIGRRMAGCAGPADLLARHANEQFALVADSLKRLVPGGPRLATARKGQRRGALTGHGCGEASRCSWSRSRLAA